jgi:hypothetical protein
MPKNLAAINHQKKHKKRFTFKKIFEEMANDNQEKDWVKVLYEIILKILTLGFYHVEKHRKDK